MNELIKMSLESLWDSIGNEVIIWLIISFALLILNGIALYRMAKKNGLGNIAVCSFFPYLNYIVLTRLAEPMSPVVEKSYYKAEEMRVNYPNRFKYEKIKPTRLFPVTPKPLLLMAMYVLPVFLIFYLFGKRYKYIYMRYAPTQVWLFTILSTIGFGPIILFLVSNREVPKVEWWEDMMNKYDAGRIKLNKKTMGETNVFTQ